MRLLTANIRYIGNSRDPNARLHWESIDDQAYQLDDRTLLVRAYIVTIDDLS